MVTLRLDAVNLDKSLGLYSLKISNPWAICIKRWWSLDWIQWTWTSLLGFTH